MKLVIDIDDYEYKRAKELVSEGLFEYNGTTAHLFKSVVNGKPLPKGHGDLIDKSKIYKAIPAEEDNCTGMGMTYDEMYAYNDGIDAMYNLLQGAKPIIEADKAESEVEL